MPDTDSPAAFGTVAAAGPFARFAGHDPLAPARDAAARWTAALDEQLQRFRDLAAVPAAGWAADLAGGITDRIREAAAIPDFDGLYRGVFDRIARESQERQERLMADLREALGRPMRAAGEMLDRNREENNALLAEAMAPREADDATRTGELPLGERRPPDAL